MRKGSSGWWILAVVLAVGFVWGLYEFITAPLETGEVYPPYSSLRSDPMGAKALYESLADVPGVKVSRLYRPRMTLLGKRDAVFVLGVDPVSWADSDRDTLMEYQQLAASGVRLVMGFVPVRAGVWPLRALEVEARWSLRLAYRTGYENHLSSAIPRRTALVFLPGDRSWKTIEERDGAAVAVERAFGNGSIVLIADTYPLSNEGLREDMNAGLVAKLAGDRHGIVFDESHFGVEETGSVTTLMRRYRLEGALAVLAVLVGLFLWRSMTSFLPPREVETAASVEGRDSMEGFARLLERNLVGEDALAICWAEWKRSAPRDIPKSRIAEAEAELKRNGSDLQKTYRAMSEILGAQRGRNDRTA